MHFYKEMNCHQGKSFDSTTIIRVQQFFDPQGLKNLKNESYMACFTYHTVLSNNTPGDFLPKSMREPLSIFTKYKLWFFSSVLGSSLILVAKQIYIQIHCSFIKYTHISSTFFSINYVQDTLAYCQVEKPSCILDMKIMKELRTLRIPRSCSLKKKEGVLAMRTKSRKLQSCHYPNRMTSYKSQPQIITPTSLTMTIPRQCLILVLFWLILLSTVEAASQPAIWSGSSLFRANMYTVISTSTTNKAVNSTVTFGTTYGTVPKLFVALFKLTALPCVNIDFDVISDDLTKTGFKLGYRVGSTSTIKLLSIYTMSFQNASSTSFMSVNHYIDPNSSNRTYLVDVVAPISSVASSGYRTSVKTVNFTSATGETLNVNNIIKAIMFIQSITMQCNSGKFNVSAAAIVINSSFYSINIYTSGNTTITKIRLARFIYDQTTLQATKTTFVDSAVVTASSTTWSQLSVTLVWKTTSNFVVGLTGIAYEPTAAMDFYYAEPTMTCTGASTFTTLSFGYWSYRYRTCPGGYPLFSDITNLCYDICDPYFYANTSAAECMPCYYTCYTCSNTSSSTNCTNCNSTVNHRQLSGTNCVCSPGYYDNGVATCVACNYTCTTCTSATGCASCSSANKRTLVSGQCPCDANYINNGTALCVACSAAISGCVTCTSTTVCTVCNTAGGFKLSGSSCVCNVGYYSSGSTCVACSIPGCQACTSATVCTSCNTALFTLGGNTCSCNGGTYLSGSTCVACTMAGCTNCTGAAVCTTCNTVAKFNLVGSSCVCQTGYYLSGTTCSSCATISGCTACSGSATCTACNSALRFVLSGSVCVCASGYFNSSGTCASCSVMPSCLQCTSSTVCTSCNSPFVLSSGSCVCNTGYFASSSTTCTACGTSITGCVACSSSTNCLQCDTPAHFVPSGTICACSLGYYLSGSTCNACMVGCSVCSSTTACTTCNTAAHYVPVGSVCECDSSNGYISSGGTCQACSSLIAGCVLCSSSSVCTLCQTGPSQVMSLTATFGCACPALYTYSVALQDCVSCPSCCQYGSYQNSGSGICQPCDTIFPGCTDCIESACSTCTVGYFLNSGACTNCATIPGCLSCTSASVCTTCDSSSHFILNGNTCFCQAGYALSASNTCITCSTSLPGCQLCTSTSVCTSCDLSSNFIANSSDPTQCICNPGYYLSGGVCIDCSTTGMAGCIECISASVCTSCDSTQYFQFNGGSCLCQLGYFISGTACLSCPNAIPGCLACTDSSTCTACDTSNLYQLTGVLCTCVDGFYLSGSTCLSCPVGCTTCDAGGSCSSCDTSNGFAFSGSTCECTTGTYLPSAGTTCLQCTAIYSMCLSCTVSSCDDCQSPATISGGVCVCSVGYYNDTLSCQTCSSQFLGCSQCTLGACSMCDTTLFFALTPVSGNCVCQPHYIMVGSACTACSSLINGCTDCSASDICTDCDSTLNFEMDSGRCWCSSTYFLNSTNNCQSCAAALIGCDTCVSSTNCTTCQSASQFILLSDNTCGCAPMHVPVGTSCVSCLISCVCTGYRWNSAGSCTSFCSDNITIYPTEECDDGNLVAGDGCSPTCTTEQNYTCIVDTLLQSQCSYNQRFNLQLLSTIKSPDSNQLTFNIAVQPNLPDLSSLDFSKLFTTSLPLGNPSFVYNNGVLQLTYSFNQSLHGQNLSINFNPGFSSFFFATPESTINFVVNPTNNLPAIVYDNNTYDQFKRMEDVYKGAVYASYGVLLLGMACNKVIGVELFGVLQLAYLSTSDLNSVQPLLSPLMNMSIVNGINLNLTNSTGQLPNRVREIGYNQLLLGNFNIMLGVMLLDILVASVILCAGCILPAFRSKSRSIAKHMFKEYLLMMVIFNVFNIAYSAGVELTYLDRSNPYFSASLAATALSLILPLAMIAAIIFTEKGGFGEFSHLYKNNLPSQGYFVFTIIYRMVLGHSMSHYNEVEEATITNVFYAIIFLLFIMVNLPYKQAYHNYRAVIIQLSNLVILSVTMYYRSMKSNTDPSVTYQILSPAMLEVVVIFASLGVSAGCLFFELAMKIKSCLRRPHNSITFHADPSHFRTENNLAENDLAENVGEKIIPEQYVPEDFFIDP